MQRIARSRAQSFEDFLIDRFASDAARSSSPTASTATVRAMSRCASAPPDNTGRRSLGWIWAAWDIGPIVADPPTGALRDPAMLIATDQTQAERNGGRTMRKTLVAVVALTALAGAACSSGGDDTRRDDGCHRWHGCHFRVRMHGGQRRPT